MDNGLVGTSLNIAIPPVLRVSMLNCPQGAGLKHFNSILRSRACPADVRSVQVQRYFWLLQDCKLSLPRVHLRRASRWSPSDPRFGRTGCTCGVPHNFGTLQTARSVPTLGSNVSALQPPVSLVSPKVAITHTSDGLPARTLPLREPAGAATQVNGGRYPIHNAGYF